MTTIIKDDFSNGAKVSMDMDKDAGELFVFHFQSGGKGVETFKYPLDSYHMPLAMAVYDAACSIELQRLND